MACTVWQKALIRFALFAVLYNFIIFFIIVYDDKKLKETTNKKLSPS